MHHLRESQITNDCNKSTCQEARTIKGNCPTKENVEKNLHIAISLITWVLIKISHKKNLRNCMNDRKMSDVL